MKAKHLLVIPCGLLAGLLALIAPQPAFAGGLHIHTVFLGGNPPPDMGGGGNLQAIFSVAAKRWERVFRKGPDSWDITIEFEWADTFTVNGAAYGDEELEAEGGTPVRPTRSLCRFRNGETPSGFFDWYADPHPQGVLLFRVEHPGLALIAQANLQGLPKPLFRAGGINRRNHFDAFGEVAEHPVG